MTRDPFLRLALIVAASGYVVGLVLVQRWLGWGALAAVAAVGPVVGAVLTVELVASPPAPDKFRRRRQPREGTAGFERLEA